MQDDQDLEWVERPLSLGDAVQCIRCRKIKLTPHFYRHKTRKQLIGMGRPNAQPEDFVHVGKVCHNCLPPLTKRLATVSRAVLDNLVGYGDITSVEYDAEVKARQQRRKDVGTAARTEQWTRVRREKWKALIASLSDEIRQITYQKHNALRSKAPDKRAEMAFFSTCQEVLTQVRACLRVEMAMRGKAPPSDDWRDYIDPQDMQTLKMLWRRVTIPRTMPMVVRDKPGGDHYPLYSPDMARGRLETVRTMPEAIDDGPVLVGRRAPHTPRAADELLAALRASALRVSNK